MESENRSKHRPNAPPPPPFCRFSVPGRDTQKLSLVSVSAASGNAENRETSEAENKVLKRRTRHTAHAPDCPGGRGKRRLNPRLPALRFTEWEAEMRSQFNQWSQDRRGGAKGSGGTAPSLGCHPASSSSSLLLLCPQIHTLAMHQIGKLNAFANRERAAAASRRQPAEAAEEQAAQIALEGGTAAGFAPALPEALASYAFQVLLSGPSAPAAPRSQGGRGGEAAQPEDRREKVAATLWRRLRHDGGERRRSCRRRSRSIPAPAKPSADSFLRPRRSLSPLAASGRCLGESRGGSGRKAGSRRRGGAPGFLGRFQGNSAMAGGEGRLLAFSK